MPDWIRFSPRTKSVLLLLATLVIGAVLGAVANAWLAQQRFERIRALRAPGGFERMVVETIRPASDSQHAAVDRVVSDAAVRIRTLRRDHHAEVRAVLDSMRTALAPVLTDAQRQRLDRRIRRGERRMRRPNQRPNQHPNQRPNQHPDRHTDPRLDPRGDPKGAAPDSVSRSGRGGAR